MGFDKRTNVLVQVLESDIAFSGIWKAQLLSSDICFLAIHHDYQEWGSVRPGDWLVAFQVLQIGRFQGAALIGIPKIGSGSALVKQWAGDLREGAPFHVYELFAGIGGWNAGLSQFSRHTVVAVEFDEEKARLLADVVGAPCVKPSALKPHHLEGSVVIQGDVRDCSWYHVSLVIPPRLVLWSVPCVSWSLGGLRRGLSVDEGMLLLETVGLCALFRPKANVGENVFGLVNHDDWSLVQAFAKSLVGEEFRVLKAYLQNLVPIPRSRVFLLQGVAGPELPRFRVALGETAWMLSEADQALFCTLTNRERELLSARALLPDSLKFKAPSYLPQQNVLELRIPTGDFFPTVVASYRYQCELNQDHIQARGLYTWLLNSGFGPRFIDAMDHGFWATFETSGFTGVGYELRRQLCCPCPGCSGSFLCLVLSPARVLPLTGW